MCLLEWKAGQEVEGGGKSPRNWVRQSRVLKWTGWHITPSLGRGRGPSQSYPRRPLITQHLYFRAQIPDSTFHGFVNARVRCFLTPNVSAFSCVNKWVLQVSKSPCIEFTILSFRNIDSTWQDFWLLLMVLWKRALTMTVSEKCEHFVSKNLSCGMCFRVTKNMSYTSLTY